MKHVFQQYLYVAVSKIGEEWDWKAIKTNREGKYMAVFENNNTIIDMGKRLELFSEWIGNVSDYQIVSYGHLTYHEFFSTIERHYTSSFPRHKVRIMKSQLWNIQSECMYRFQFKQELSIEEILFLYKQDYIKHPEPLMEEMVNLITLCNMFLFDKQQTQRLMQKSKEDVLLESYSKYNLNQLMMLLLEKGWKFRILGCTGEHLQVNFINEEDLSLERCGADLNSLIAGFLVEMHKLTENKNK